MNTSSPDYLHNVLLARLLTRPGHPLMSISLELTHISASNLSLPRTRRSRLKVLKFVNALRDQIIPILSLDRPWGFSDTLETLIVSEIPMKMVSGPPALSCPRSLWGSQKTESSYVHLLRTRPRRRYRMGNLSEFVMDRVGSRAERLQAEGATRRLAEALRRVIRTRYARHIPLSVCSGSQQTL